MASTLVGISECGISFALVVIEDDELLNFEDVIFSV